MEYYYYVLLRITINHEERMINLKPKPKPKLLNILI